jgi:hypothetical protein
MMLIASFLREPQPTNRYIHISVATSFRGCVKINIIDLNLKLNSSKLPLPLGEGWGEGQQNILFSTFHTASLTHGMK